jgi:flagellar basal body-associated protein FliL
VKNLDSALILIIILGVIFCAGGPIIGHYATKACEKAEREEANKNKTK